MTMLRALGRVVMVAGSCPDISPSGETQIGIVAVVETVTSGVR